MKSWSRIGRSGTAKASITYPRGPDPAGHPRLFFAVPLPEATVKVVAGIVDGVRSTVASPPGRDVRWVRLDGLHLTIRFLGATPIERVPELAEACRQAAAAIRPFDVSIEGAGAFPSEARPRAIWLGIGAGADRLGDLAAEVDRRLAALGWEPSERPFRAHLTLARSDGVRAGPVVARALAAAIAGQRLEFRASELILFESQTGSGRATYLPLHQARLAG